MMQHHEPECHAGIFVVVVVVVVIFKVKVTVRLQGL